MSAGKNRPLIAVDSMALVWGVRQDVKHEKVIYAKRLFKQLSDRNAIIILPSIVVAEYLSEIAADKHDATIAGLKKLARIEPFDLKDAAIAARLYNFGKSLRKGNPGYARKALRADSLIVAIAKNRGCVEFYTDDKGCLALAKHVGLDARPIPTTSTYLWPDGVHRQGKPNGEEQEEARP